MNPSDANTDSSLLPVMAGQGGLPPVPPEVGLWPESVEGPVLLNQVASTFSRYLVLPPGAADALALIIAHFHCFDAFMHTPRLSFQAMEKGCGKTTALEIAACLVPGPCVAENMSTAVLYRLAGMRGITLLLDEVDTWVLKDDLLRGLLNAGHRRGGQVWRYEKPHGPRRYEVFGPVVLAGIGALPDTLQDRSIVIRLTRAKPGEVQARFDSRRTATEDQLRARLARWAHDHFDSLEKADPVLPDNVHNRMADNWRPLFAIAEVAGGDWPRRAAQAFRLLNLNLDGEDQSVRIQLLNDIRAIFTVGRTDRLPSIVLARELAKLEGQPWALYDGRRAISNYQVAHLLRGFKIPPHTIRCGTLTAKGYLLADFEDTFARFLTSKP
jgi:hypothetical protein